MKDRNGTGLSRDKNLRVNKNAGYKFVKKDKSVNKRAGLHDKKTNIAEGERRVVRVKPLALKHKRRMRKAAVVLAAVCVRFLMSGWAFCLNRKDFMLKI